MPGAGWDAGIPCGPNCSRPLGKYSHFLNEETKSQRINILDHRTRIRNWVFLTQKSNVFLISGNCCYTYTADIVNLPGKALVYLEVDTNDKFAELNCPICLIFLYQMEILKKAKWCINAMKTVPTPEGGEVYWLHSY